VPSHLVKNEGGAIGLGERHCNRHTFASWLVMAGVDLRTVQDLGGWRTLAMVQRRAEGIHSRLDPSVPRSYARAATSLLAG
jgi:site-specific recombinase XerD